MGLGVFEVEVAATAAVVGGGVVVVHVSEGPGAHALT